MTADVDVYRQQGFAGRIGFGQRPALLIVDFVNGFNDPGVFGGGNIADAIAATHTNRGWVRLIKGLPS